MHTIPPDDDPDDVRDDPEAPTRSASSRSRAGRRCRCCRGCGRERFYDLVVEVAIVRPGPIQGDMVHPVPADGASCSDSDPNFRVAYPQAGAASRCCAKTLGVPLFQEQVMKDGDGRRRLHRGRRRTGCAARWRRGSVGAAAWATFEGKFVDGMLAQRLPAADFAEQCLQPDRAASATTAFPRATPRRSPRSRTSRAG